MKCEQARDLLSPYFDGMCSEKEHNLVETHLASCPRCRQELEELRRVSACLKQLATPELPDGFAEQLHQRLVEKPTLLFNPGKMRKPVKQGWIAAALAGLALAGGIYASSVLPLSGMVAAWQDKTKQQNNKPAVAINRIIDRISNPKQEQPAQQNPVPMAKTGEKAQTPDPVDKTNKTEEENNAATPPAQVAENNTTDNTMAPSLKRYYSASCSTRLKVQDAAASLKQVQQIAEAAGYDYDYNANGLQAMSGGNARGITIRVKRDEVQKALNQLSVAGSPTTPLYSSVEITDTLNEVERSINSAQEEKNALAGKAQSCPEDQERLNALNNQLQLLNRQKADLEKEADMVTINVYFVEEVNP